MQRKLRKTFLWAMLASSVLCSLSAQVQAQHQLPPSSDEEAPSPSFQPLGAAGGLEGMDAPLPSTRDAVSSFARSGEKLEREARSRQVSEAAKDSLKVPYAELGQGQVQAPGPLALPAGAGDKSGATAQATPLPGAEGSQSGMGESFNVTLTSGDVNYAIPIVAPPGRLNVQPTLSLTYSTTAGNGPLGFGWNIGTPFIARQTDRGMPEYVRAPDGLYHPREDRFIYNGGQELVPVNSSAMAQVDGYGAAPPSDLISYQEYRSKINNGFERFFRSPDHLHWVVQTKDGSRAEFGVIPEGHGPPSVGTFSQDSLSRDPEDPNRIHRWALTRFSDAHGSTIYYRYFQEAGQTYLWDIHYVSPNSCLLSSPVRDCQEPLDTFGARVEFSYEPRPDAYASYVSGYRIETAQRVARITMTAAQEDVGQRFLVRRYHLSYDEGSFHSLLSTVLLEGRPQTFDSSAGSYVANRYVAESSLSSKIIGELSPEVRLFYSAPTGSGEFVPGFGSVDDTVHDVLAPAEMPSAGQAQSDFFDVNSDGLPDLLVTDPGRYRTPDGRPAVGVYFNGFSGAEALPALGATFSEPVGVAVPPGLSDVMNLASANIVPMDADGDGRTDLLHMPRRFEYGYFTPTRGPDGQIAPVSPKGQAWRFAYARVSLDRNTADPRIDFGSDAPFIRTFDVNRDNLVDIVRSTGTVMQTWLNLGFHQGGEGRFGSATFQDGQWQLSTDPIESCVLYWGNRPIDFASPEVKIADLNGDGLSDIVFVRDGRVVYWPTRGPGSFGDGPFACPRGAGANRGIVMQDPPVGLFDTDQLAFEDIDMDGAADLVRVRYTGIDIWFNRAGAGFTAPLTIDGTPAKPDFAPNIRFLDIDGSATSDIVWAYAGRYQYVDPMGGVRPRLLTRVENGLGAATNLSYGSSAREYLRDLRAAASCTDAACERFAWSQVEDACDESLLRRAGECVHRAAGSPVVSTVVLATETSDQLDQLGLSPNVLRNEYAYHEGYYEGFEQEFRGYGTVDVRQIGDPTEPTVITRTRFHQGRRPSAIASDRLAENPREAIKGQGYLEEQFDEAGVYLSSSHTTFTVRRLTTGLDGRVIVMSYPSQHDQLRYDTSPFYPSANAFEAPSVLYEDATASTPIARGAEPAHALKIRGAGYALLRNATNAIDNVGNALEQTNYGRILGENGERPDERITQHSRFALINSDAWIFRPVETYVTGHGMNPAVDGYDRLKPTTLRYDAFGAEIRRDEEIRVPATQTFAGDGRAESLIQQNQRAIASVRRDGWGNALAMCAGADLATSPATDCLQYSETDFDAPFAALSIGTRKAASRANGAFTFITGQVEWDRGYALALIATDENNQRSESRYDGLGRLSFQRIPPIGAACAGSTVPAKRMEYEVAKAGTPISVQVTYTYTDCSSLDTQRKLVERKYIDGLGRVRAKLDRAGPDRWVRSVGGVLNARGQATRSYHPSYYQGSDVSPAAVLEAPNTPFNTVLRDAFNRDVAHIAEDGTESRSTYHALSKDLYDALDLSADPLFAGTATTTRNDGHDRPIDLVLRNRFPDRTGMEYIRLFTTYRADDAVLKLTRARTGTDAPNAAREAEVERTFQHDSSARRLWSHDRDTDSPSGATWRYLHNSLGNLVAIRDPRGCGQNFYYDFAGRLIGEDYVSCAEAQARRDLPATPFSSDVVSLGAASGTNRAVDVVYYFDRMPSWASGELVPTANFGMGRLNATSDRAQRGTFGYDARGNLIFSARQIALVDQAPATSATVASPPTIQAEGTQGASLRVYDTAHTYVQTSQLDHASRPTAKELPRSYDPSQPSGRGPSVVGRILYDEQGLPARTFALLGGIEQTILGNVVYDAQGHVTWISYGDDRYGTRPATGTQTEYDSRGRPVLSMTLRAPTEADQGDRPLGAVDVPFGQSYTWDAVSNLTDIRDERDPTEWPAGYRPVRARVFHDALYRAVNTQFSYLTDVSGEHVWSSSDTATDWRGELSRVNADGLTHLQADPMRAKPAPLLARNGTDRVSDLTWDWDWLGNMNEWSDDASVFYERSIGRITNGYEIGARPTALYLASNLPTAPPSAINPTVDRGGYVELDYGSSGNVAAVTVHARCVDNQAGGSACFDSPGQGLTARREALRNRCACQSEQHYQYRWDEVNRISEARRYDRAGGVGSYALAGRLRYWYDAANSRVIKESVPVSGASQNAFVLSVFDGDFERRGVVRSATGYDDSPTLDTENQYFISGARITWEPDADDLSGDALVRDARVVVPLQDLIETTSAALDLRSGELLEYSTYYPNGARETFRTQNRVSLAPEPLGFTGKEADEDVGLVYFGERYLLARLGRWASPDPLSIHHVGGGEALNSYHYVNGNILQARDPVGLDPSNWVHTFDTKGEMNAWRERGGSCADEAACIAGVGTPETGFTVYEWDRSKKDFVESARLSSQWNSDPSAYYASRIGRGYLYLETGLAALAGIGIAIEAGLVAGANTLYTEAGQYLASQHPWLVTLATEGIKGLLEEYGALGFGVGVGVVAGKKIATEVAERGFEAVPVMSTDVVKKALDAVGYAGERVWAYAVHLHHIYPKWLGGREDGPQMAVRGLEHITDLEPKLFEHMKRAIPAIKEKTSSHIQDLLSSGQVTRKQIDDALASFYSQRYPNLSAGEITETLSRGRGN